MIRTFFSHFFTFNTYFSCFWLYDALKVCMLSRAVMRSFHTRNHIFFTLRRAPTIFSKRLQDWKSEINICISKLEFQTVLLFATPSFCSPLFLPFQPFPLPISLSSSLLPLPPFMNLRVLKIIETVWRNLQIFTNLSDKGKF